MYMYFGNRNSDEKSASIFRAKVRPEIRNIYANQNNYTPSYMHKIVTVPLMTKFIKK